MRLCVPPGATGVRSLDDAPEDIVVDEEFRMAAGMHPGLCHEHNEDAVALVGGRTPRGEPFRIMVVCDGVSSSTDPERTSRIAAQVVRDTLAQMCFTGDIAVQSGQLAVAEAIRRAHAALCEKGFEVGADGPPGTTCVAALVIKNRLAVGWVGDSRAYWVTDCGAELLTRDHSWVNEAMERGEVTLEEALRSPFVHALTHCLGPLESIDTPVRPDVIARELAGPGVILLCSDGLWNYYPSAKSMAALVRSCAPPRRPDRIARFVVRQALARGGHDNVSTIVYLHEDEG